MHSTRTASSTSAAVPSCTQRVASALVTGEAITVVARSVLAMTELLQRAMSERSILFPRLSDRESQYASPVSLFTKRTITLSPDHTGGFASSHNLYCSQYAVHSARRSVRYKGGRGFG